jgi:WD40 repeat protein
VPRLDYQDSEGRRWKLDALECTETYRAAGKRRVARERALEPGSAGAAPGQGLVAPEPSASRVAIAQEQAEALQRAVDRLPEDYRAVILLRHQEKLSFEEIARRMNRSVPAVRQLWSRAVRQVRLDVDPPMNPDKPEPLEEQFDAVLASYDEALVTGRALPADGATDVAAELRADLEHVLACAQLLHEVFQRPGAGPLPAREAVADDSAMPWTRLGRFEIRRQLGRGTFGIVYLAYDPRLAREVALKVPRLNALADPPLRERFHREARAAAGLDHPNIVPVYEAGEVGPVCFLASAYCPGLTLAQWLRQRDRPVPFQEAAHLVALLADAVHHAHTRGVVHRDLKPANVLLQVGSTKAHEATPRTDKPGQESSSLRVASCAFVDDCYPKITDFGLAKIRLEEGETRLTGSGVVGTADYMAPEQAGGKRQEVGPAADTYALGAILYELLTGRPPFQAETGIEMLLLVRSEDPLPPGRLRRKVPRDLETICLKCLEKDPRRRYATAQALADDLRRFLAGEPIRARPTPAWERGLKWAKRRPAVAALFAAILLGFVGVTWQWLRAQATGRELELTLYYQRIALAEREWSANNLARADQLLDDCPVAMRGWEWHYVKGLRRGNPPALRGHTLPVWSVVFSPDGKYLASASQDQTVKIWEVLTGREVRTLRGSNDLYALGVAFSPDGKCLVSVGTRATTVRLTEILTGRELRTFTFREGPVRHVAFAPDGRHLAVALGKAQLVKVCDADTGSEVATFTGHTGNVICAALSPDGRRIASAGHDHVVRIWDEGTGREVLSLPTDTTKVMWVTFSPHGKSVASAGGPWFRGDDGEVKIWDAATGLQARTLHGHTGHIFCVAFSPDGRRLATAGYDQTVKIWDAGTGQEVLTLRGHSQAVSCIAYSPNGRFLASCGGKNIRLWDATPLDERPDPAVRTLHPDAGRQTTVAYSPDGQRLASAGQDMTIRIWDPSTGRETMSLAGHTAHVNKVVFSPDGPRLASASMDKSVKVWDSITGRELISFAGHAAVVHNLAFSFDGQRIASCDWQKTIRVWNAGTGKELVTLKGHQHVVTSVAFHPDDRCLASASMDGTVKLWDLPKGTALHTFTGHDGRVMCVAFSPDGRHLASAATDGTVRLWDASRRACLRILRGNAGWVWCVAFSPDGRHLASAGNDAVIRLWDAKRGEQTASFHGHTRWVESVAFSPDGRTLASASWDGTVKLWQLTAAR